MLTSGQEFRGWKFFEKQQVEAKVCCPPEWAGWNAAATHQRDPTTAPRGQFELFPAGPAPGARLSKPPGRQHLRAGAHADAALSADAGSTWSATPSEPRPPTIQHTRSPVAKLQRCATTPSWSERAQNLTRSRG